MQLEVGVEVQQRCFQRQSISRSRAIQCLPTFARMTGSKRRRTHIARRGRSMGATVRSCHAAPMQSRKQASAGSTRDEWFATKALVPSPPPRRSPSSDCGSGLPGLLRRKADAGRCTETRSRVAPTDVTAHARMRFRPDLYRGSIDRVAQLAGVARPNPARPPLTIGRRSPRCPCARAGPGHRAQDA